MRGHREITLSTIMMATTGNCRVERSIMKGGEKRKTGLTFLGIDSSIQILGGTDGTNLGLDVSGNLILLTRSESFKEIQ